MDCCQIKYYGIFIDPETGKEFLAPIDPLYCPICGTPLIPGA